MFFSFESYNKQSIILQFYFKMTFPHLEACCFFFFGFWFFPEDKKERNWILERGEGFENGRSGGRGECVWDVLFVRRINFLFFSFYLFFSSAMHSDHGLPSLHFSKSPYQLSSPVIHFSCISLYKQAGQAPRVINWTGNNKMQ